MHHREKYRHRNFVIQIHPFIVILHNREVVVAKNSPYPVGTIAARAFHPLPNKCDNAATKQGVTLLLGNNVKADSHLVTLYIFFAFRISINIVLCLPSFFNVLFNSYFFFFLVRFCNNAIYERARTLLLLLQKIKDRFINKIFPNLSIARRRNYPGGRALK